MSDDNFFNRSINQPSDSGGTSGFLIGTGSNFDTEGAGALVIPTSIPLPVLFSQVTNTITASMSVSLFGIAPREFTVRGMTIIVSGTATIPTDMLTLTVTAGPAGGPFAVVGTSGPLAVAPNTPVSFSFAAGTVPAGSLYIFSVDGNTLGAIGPADETYMVTVGVDATF